MRSLVSSAYGNFRFIGSGMKINMQFRKPTVWGRLELGMEACGERVHRTAVPVVGGVGGELVVEADARVGGKRVAVISLEDFLEPGIRQLSVADEDAPAAGVEKRLVNAADVIHGTGAANGVVGHATFVAR